MSDIAHPSGELQIEFDDDTDSIWITGEGPEACVRVDEEKLRWLLFCGIPATLAMLSSDGQEEAAVDDPSPGGRATGPPTAGQPMLPFD